MSTTPSDAGGRRPEGALPADRPPDGTGTGPLPLRRSTSDKVVAGVAGGLGHYLGVDPVIIRIAVVVLALTGGAGVLLYLIGWIAIPEEQPGEIPPGTVRTERSSGAVVLGGVLIIVGALLLTDRVIPAFSTYLGPLVLVALGAALIMGVRR